jgi:hypothetical protein
MCFSLGAIEQLIIWLIVICAVVAIVRLLLVPYVLAPLGPPGTIIVQVLNILLWVVIAIAVVYLVFDLLSCAFSGGGYLGGGIGPGRVR